MKWKWFEMNQICRSESTGSVKVIHGGNDDTFNIAGVEIQIVRRNLADAFNLPTHAIPFVNGVRVSLDFHLVNGDTLEFVAPWGRKGATDDRDDYFLKSTDTLLKLNEVIYRLGRLEKLVTDAINQQAPSKEFYTVEEFGKLVDSSPYTVREHCRLGRLNATKAQGGRGDKKEWRISHSELIRYRNHGLLPLRKHGS